MEDPTEAAPTVEPIAVIGLACRVPGAADAEQLWRNLVDGQEALRWYSREEQLELGLPPDVVDDPNFVPAAMVVDDHKDFDAAYFGMSVREAEIRDPQHRLFLELAATALEDAGYDPRRHPGEIGVYAGTGGANYQWLNVRSNPEAYAKAGWLAVVAGNHADYCATFTSYKLDLRGPSYTLHTACSTSLVTVHIACEALRNGECDMALSGGAMFDLPQGSGYVHDEGGVESGDGHCRPFEARSTGTIWGSGGGIVVLKRLEDALADGDHVRAVIRGNAVNNDGATKVGFSAPSQEGQAVVVAQALGVAGIDPRTVTYVEAHGTGTALGDPIEVAALSSSFGQTSDDAGWCGIGSIKSNIGHLGQAAGVAGLIKAVLAVERGVIPPTLHFEQPNPKIDFGENPFYVVDQLTPWEPEGLPRRAGVSSFGIGGTNAHIVLEEAPAPVARPVADRRPRVLRLSARTEPAVSTACGQLAAHLEAHPDLDLADVAHTLRVGRREMAVRAAVVAHDPTDAAAALVNPRRVITGGPVRRPPRVALLFSGQGAQYPGMGADLYESEPVFRDAVDRCAAGLREELGGEDIRTVMFAADDPAADERLRQTAWTQPALFTVEYALAELWRSWGVEPDGMIGHSIGEYVAATVAGVFPLDGALRLVAARGRLMQGLPPGSMLAVQLGPEEIRDRLTDGLAVATVNAPGTCVVSGPTVLVDELAERLRGDDVICTALRTSHAFHSPMMDPILAEFRALVAATELSAPQLPLLSNVTGTWMTSEDATDPSYWARHLRDTVRFGECVETLLAEGDWLLVECGPGAQLAGLASLQAEGVAPVPSLPGPDRSPAAATVLATAAATLWVHGVPVGGDDEAAARVPLPTYPWERKRCWIEPGPGAGTSITAGSPTVAAAAPARPAGPLPIDQWFSVPVWREVPARPGAVDIDRALVFADDSSAELVAALRATGTDVVVVRPGEAFDLAELPDRIVHAWAVTETTGVWPAQDRSFFSLLALVQALAARPELDAVRLDIVTANTQDVTGGDLTCPEHATVAGIARVVPLEAPWLEVRHIDVDRADDWAAAACDELRRGGEAPPAVALRRGRRWVQSYEPVTVPPAPVEPREGGVYVVTGGLGGIGITLAEDLGCRTRARLVLVSRTGLDGSAGGRAGRALAAIRRIEAAGGEVLTLAADVTSAEDLRRVRDATLDRFGRVDGIVHAAGVPGGGMAEVKERPEAEQVMAPKLLGPEALREAFGDLDLDAVVLCSSITAVTGGFGQVDYCAANNYLDAYARSDHGWRARVVSLDWGGWLDVGMAAEVAAPEGFRALLRGVSLDPEAAAPTAPVDHPLVTALHPAAGDGEMAWCRASLTPARHWVLDEHRIAGAPVLPGTGFVEMARAAAEQVLPPPVPGQVLELRDVAFVEPLVVPDGTTAEVRVVFAPDAGGADLEVRSGPDGADRVHVQASVGWVDGAAPASVDLDAVRARCDQAAPGTTVPLSGVVAFGPHWDSLDGRWIGQDEALASLALGSADEGWGLHPALLDVATSFHWEGVEGNYLPFGYGRVVAHRPLPGRVWSHIRFPGGTTAEVLTADVTLTDDAGNVLVEIRDYVIRRIDVDAVTARMDGAPPAVGIRPVDGAEAFRRLWSTPVGRQVVVSETPLDEVMAQVAGVTQETVETALESQAEARTSRASEDGDHLAPRDDLEATIARLWADVLGGDGIGIDEDFFELGGNSLVAVQLIALIRKELKVRVPMRELFDQPTVAGVAAVVAGLVEPAPPPTTIPRLPRQAARQS